MPTLVITGGTKGIGRAIVEAFAQQGFRIVTCSRHEKELAELKQYIENQYHTDIYVKVTDVADQVALREFAHFALEKADSLAALVNNSGIFLTGNMTEEPDGTLEKMMETNLYSGFYLTRHLLETFKKQQKGHIFNICSIASQKPFVNSGSYSITKFAQYGFSQVLREELKPFGIKVTAVLPGATFTAAWNGVDIQEDRIMSPADIAALIWSCYQLSPRSVVEELVIRPQLGDL